MSADVQVFCPAALPRHCYVVQVAAAPDPVRCWLVPVTLAGGPADWSRREEVPLPDLERLGPRAFDGGPLVRSIRSAIRGASHG